jgi:hypothetical protein
MFSKEVKLLLGAIVAAIGSSFAIFDIDPSGVLRTVVLTVTISIGTLAANAIAKRNSKQLPLTWIAILLIIIGGIGGSLSGLMFLKWGSITMQNMVHPLLYIFFVSISYTLMFNIIYLSRLYTKHRCFIPVLSIVAAILIAIARHHFFELSTNTYNYNMHETLFLINNIMSFWISGITFSILWTAMLKLLDPEWGLKLDGSYIERKKRFVSNCINIKIFEN